METIELEWVAIIYYGSKQETLAMRGEEETVRNILAAGLKGQHYDNFNLYTASNYSKFYEKGAAL